MNETTVCDTIKQKLNKKIIHIKKVFFSSMQNQKSILLVISYFKKITTKQKLKKKLPSIEMIYKKNC